MKNADSLTRARRFLQYAREDLLLAEAALSGGFAPRQICYLGFQAAEKSLFAVFAYLALPPPHSRDLEKLIHHLPEGWAVAQEALDVAELTEWAVEAAYPGAWPEADTAEAARAVETAHRVVELVCADFRHLGVDC